MRRFPLCPLLFAAACSSATSAPDGVDGTRPGFPGAGQSGGEGLPGAVMACFYGDDPAAPAASVEHVLEVVDGVDTLHVRLTLDPAFVDNTYGATAIGWADAGKKGGHTFEDLVKSDRAQLVFSSAGVTTLDLMTDYLSDSAAAPSGYATLGVSGGEGELLAGDTDAILAISTSMDRNLNERGHGGFLIDSPVTDASWSPSPAAPDWDFRVVYEAWIDAATVGADPAVALDYIHASPSKGADNTMVVDPQPCPPDWGCQEPDGCYGDGGDGACHEPDGCGDSGSGGVE